MSETINDCPSSINEIAANQPITSQEVRNAIMKTKLTCKAFDPDGFHPKLLKHSGPYFLTQFFLTRLFNTSFDKENRIWRDGKVIFLIQPGKKTIWKPRTIVA